MPNFQKSEGFKLKSGNKPSYKTMNGESPLNQGMGAAVNPSMQAPVNPDPLSTMGVGQQAMVPNPIMKTGSPAKDQNWGAKDPYHGQGEHDVEDKHETSPAKHWPGKHPGKDGHEKHTQKYKAKRVLDPLSLISDPKNYPKKDKPAKTDDKSGENGVGTEAATGATGTWTRSLSRLTKTPHISKGGKKTYELAYKDRDMDRYGDLSYAEYVKEAKKYTAGQSTTYKDTDLPEEKGAKRPKKTGSPVKTRDHTQPWVYLATQKTKKPGTPKTGSPVKQFIPLSERTDLTEEEKQKIAELKKNLLPGQFIGPDMEVYEHGEKEEEEKGSPGDKTGSPAKLFGEMKEYRARRSNIDRLTEKGQKKQAEAERALEEGKYRKAGRKYGKAWTKADKIQRIKDKYLGTTPYDPETQAPPVTTGNEEGNIKVEKTYGDMPEDQRDAAKQYNIDTYGTENPTAEANKLKITKEELAKRHKNK